MVKKYGSPLFFVFLILVLDQVSKIWVKTNMYLGQEYKIFGNWFIIHFTENNGMAFGLEFAGDTGKLILSVFRIIASVVIFWYLFQLISKKAPKGIIVSVSLILAGALGNILDSAFYGVIFSDSTYRVAQFLPEGGGYSNYLYGKVVDMLYFPVIKGFLPHWIPFWGGDYFVFFRPVFNIADSAVSIGVGIILFSQRKFLQKNL